MNVFLLCLIFSLALTLSLLHVKLLVMMYLSSFYMIFFYHLLSLHHCVTTTDAFNYSVPCYVCSRQHHLYKYL